MKSLLSAKEKDEGARGLETVKVQLRTTLVSNTEYMFFIFYNNNPLGMFCSSIKILNIPNKPKMSMSYINNKVSQWC